MLLFIRNRYSKHTIIVGIVAAVVLVGFVVGSFMGDPSPVTMARRIVSAQADTVGVDESQAALDASAKFNAQAQFSQHAPLVVSMAVASDGRTLYANVDRAGWDSLAPQDRVALRDAVLRAFTETYWKRHRHPSPAPRVIFEDHDGVMLAVPGISPRSF